ncbi:MAG: GIY-YIG nuclease family protein [Longimicrobiales bacterium]
MQQAIPRSMRSAIPPEPGVYLFGDRAGEVLYVGKARNLRRRVMSYFRATDALQFKTRALMQRAQQMELLVVRTEWDALLLEARLIRSLRPRFNTKLKDSRGYPFLEIRTGPTAPCVRLSDRVRRNGAVWFGPVPEAAAVHSALEVVRRLYLLRAESFEHVPLDAEVRRMAVDMLDLMNGSGDIVAGRVTDAMDAAANILDFERALRLRDALVTLRRMARYPQVRPGRDPAGRGVAVLDSLAIDLQLTRNTRN